MKYQKIFARPDGITAVIDGLRELDHVFKFFGFGEKYTLEIELRTDGLHIFSDGQKHCATYPLDYLNPKGINHESL